MADIQILVEKLEQRPDFVDPEGVHHKFVNGMHGRKIDWGIVVPGMPEFDKVVDLTFEAVVDEADIVIGMANGFTEQAKAVGERLRKCGRQVTTLTTEKLPSKKVVLSARAKKQLVMPSSQGARIKLLDDLGTEGSTPAGVASEIRELGDFDISAFYIMQRRAQLELLDDAEVPYTSLYTATDLPTYTPADCIDHGHCADNWQLKEHGE